MPNENENQAGTPAPAPKGPSSQQIARFVSKVKNLDQQIGEHVLAALQHPDTAAVLTTVVVGPSGEQHIVSASLNPERMSQINELLESAHKERVEDEVCFGFHCLLRRTPE